MKKTFSILMGLMLLLNITVISADEIDAEVNFNQNEQLVYELDNKDVFTDMIPGEVKSQSIKVTNNNTKEADFYINLSDVVSLEEDGVTSGVYTISLAVDNTVIFDSELGGMSSVSSKNTDKQGLEALSDSVIGTSDVFIASLKNGESVNLVVELGLGGESVRNGYINKQGSIGFDFSVNYKEPVRITEVEKVIQVKSEPRINVVAVNTGDYSNIIPLLLTTILGSIVILLTFFKKKRGVDNEN